MNYITSWTNWNATSDVSQSWDSRLRLGLGLRYCDWNWVCSRRARFGLGSGSTTALQLAGCQWLIVLLLLLSAVSVAAASSLWFWISVSSESYFSCAIAGCHLVASPAAFPFHSEPLDWKAVAVRERERGREGVMQHTHAQCALSGIAHCQCLFIYHELHRIFQPLPHSPAHSLSLFYALWPDILSLSLAALDRDIMHHWNHLN